MTHLQAVLQFFKTLADENRLRIIGLLGSQERSVGELAELLDLTEPTVSHHLARLREQGLVNLRAAGNMRLYRLNRPTLERQLSMARDVEAISRETPREKPDLSWIDELALSAADRKVLRDYCWGVQLKEIPTKEKKLLAVLRWVIQRFETGRTYEEHEVNARLKPVHEDYARLRRELVNFGFLAREGGGGSYWRTEEANAK